ncbi:MAG: aspartate-semialdehyde dehydrogenase [Pseudomonadota bacterium]
MHHNKPKVGLIGWRGMVGTVLLQRLVEENQFQEIEALFYSSSQVGNVAPDFGQQSDRLLDVYNLQMLSKANILIVCQGNKYTQDVYQKLRQSGWTGYWLDASSALRLHADSIIVLDPLNRQHINQALCQGMKTFVGANCTVSLLMLAIAGLLQADLVDWISTASYQAISGAGAQAMQTFIKQLQWTAHDLPNTTNILASAKTISEKLMDNALPAKQINSPLLANVLPWIDSEMSNGQTREEWKAGVELNKILQLETDKQIAIDGTCVRVGTIRSHAQAITLKLKRCVPIDDIEQYILQAHPWVKLVPNQRKETLAKLTPLAVSNTLNIAVGRVRKMSMGEEYLNLFTVGDQLLWGAAEPLHRMLSILIDFLN